MHGVKIVKRYFQTLKTMLMTATVLILPDLSKEFFLWTDASACGFETILGQRIVVESLIQMRLQVGKPTHLRVCNY